jgi:hypothetical protein
VPIVCKDITAVFDVCIPLEVVPWVVLNLVLNLVLKVNGNNKDIKSGVLEKRLSNGWRKRQVTLVVLHKAGP